MTDVIRALSALSAAVSAAVGVMLASPGVSLPDAVVVGGLALSAALAAAVAVLAKPAEPI